MSKLAPLVRKEPIEVQNLPVSPIIPPKSHHQNRFSDFNVNPRGWNSSSDHYSECEFRISNFLIEKLTCSCFQRVQNHLQAETVIKVAADWTNRFAKEYKNCVLAASQATSK
jgi:hypothetical protein